jgi:hypothetical protein
MTFGRMTLGRMTLGRMTLGRIILGRMTICKNDRMTTEYHYNTRQNEIR